MARDGKKLMLKSSKFRLRKIEEHDKNIICYNQIITFLQKYLFLQKIVRYKPFYFKTHAYTRVYSRSDGRKKAPKISRSKYFL